MADASDPTAARRRPVLRATLLALLALVMVYAAFAIYLATRPVVIAFDPVKKFRVSLPKVAKPDDAAWPAYLAREVVPAFAKRFPDVAVDAFCERNALSVAQCHAVLEAARAAGLASRLHTDQFTSLGGAEMAVEAGARTSDHLEAATPETVRAVGASKTVAVILPCSGYALDGRYAPGRALIDAGAAVAIGSNANPGSAPTVDLRFAMHLAVRHAGLSCAEAISAATVNAAHALGLGEELGRLEPGLRANLIVLDERDERSLVHAFGAPPPTHVVLGGSLVGA